MSFVVYLKLSINLFIQTPYAFFFLNRFITDIIFSTILQWSLESTNFYKTKSSA